MRVAEGLVALAHGRLAVILPPEAQALVSVLVPHFTTPTSQQFSVLLVGALVTTGRRTVANLLRALRHLAPGHPTDYQRVLSRAPWSGLGLGCALMRFVLDHLLPDGPVRLVGDDTVDRHTGPHVCGKARHRDAVRSSHSYTVFRYGHTWVVLAVLAKFPFATRPWALPVLIDLYRSADDDRKRSRPRPGPHHVRPVAPAADPVPGPSVRIRRGFRVWHPRRGSVLRPPPRAPHPGQQVTPGRAPVRSAPAVCG